MDLQQLVGAIFRRLIIASSSKQLSNRCHNGSTRLAPSSRGWAGCPQPLPLETLSSWVFRVAAFYHTHSNALLKEFRDRPSQLLFLDEYRSPDFLMRLSKASGISYHRLRQMTLARWVVPIHLNGGKYQFYHKEYYKAYITGFRCQKKVSAKKDFYIPSLPWIDSDWQNAYRGCSACLASDQIPYERLTWRFGLVQSCPIHGLNLVPHSSRGIIRATQKPGASVAQTRIPYPSLLKLDAMTTYALRNGSIELSNGRRVSAACWLRLVMGLADELLRVEEHYLHGYFCSPVYKSIWDRLGYPVPIKSRKRYAHLEPVWRRYHLQLFAAVGVLIDMLAEGEVRVIAGRRVRRMFRK